jgi:hypothetical protein
VHSCAIAMLCTIVGTFAPGTQMPMLQSTLRVPDALGGITSCNISSEGPCNPGNAHLLV